jgi:hypothetical protein
MPAKTKKENNPPQLRCKGCDLAEMFGVNITRINQLVQDGVVKKLAKGDYLVVESVKNYIARQKARAKDTVKTEGVADIETSKARKEEAMAGLAELKLAEAKMEVVRIADIDERDAKIGSAVRAATMKRRSELPPILEGLSASQIVTILDDHDRAILEKLADMQSEFWERHEKLKAAMSNE